MNSKLLKNFLIKEVIIGMNGLIKDILDAKILFNNIYVIKMSHNSISYALKYRQNQISIGVYNSLALLEDNINMVLYANCHNKNIKFSNYKDEYFQFIHESKYINFINNFELIEEIKIIK